MQKPQKKTNSRHIKRKTLHRIINMTLVAAIIWGILFLTLGMITPALFPLGFSIILGTAILLKGKIISERILTRLYIGLIFILPLSLQLVMGGVTNSGLMGIWSLLAPIGALLFLRQKDSIYLFIAFLIALTFITAIEFITVNTTPVSQLATTSMLIANIIAVITIVFLALKFFTNQIVKSKNIITSKDETIDTGLEYAKSVQQSLINANLKTLEQHLNFFIYCKPKDTVCGDFLWSNSKNNIIHLVVADCNGHGVPAAFLSILGSTLLDEIIIKNNTQDPATILTLLNQEIKQKQNMASNKKFNDCLMDISVLRIDLETKKIEYTLANTSLIISNDTDHETITETNNSIGEEHNPYYETKDLNLPRESTLYLFSNGIKNQLNNRQEKIGLKGVEDTIRNLSNKSIVAQEVKIHLEIDKLTKNIGYSDDILLFGLKF